MRLLGLEIRKAPPSPVSDNRGGWWPFGRVREPYAGAWQRNDEWTTDTVAAHHAVYACVTRIAQDVGKLRPRLVEFDPETGIWTEAKNSAHSPVLARPNRFQNYIQFKESWKISKLLYGNTYVLQEFDGRGVVEAQYLLDPSRVTVLVGPDGEVFYDLKRDNLSGLEQESIAVPAVGEQGRVNVVHDRINCLFHPLVGTSPIFACGMAANMGLNIQRNSEAFFRNGSNLSGLLTSTVDIPRAKALELQETWNSQAAGVRSGFVGVLGGGLTFSAMRMSAVDSQLIEQLRWSAETVCSTFHVPPWKIGIGSQPAYTKPEIANQAYYSDCLQALIEQWELCQDEALGLTKTVKGPDGRARQLGVELDLDGLLRMDMASQVSTLKEAVSGSLYTVNDARRSLSKPPVPGGDSIWMQQQNYSLEALAERDRNDPFAKPPAPPPPAPDAPAADPAAEPDEEMDEERAARLARRIARATRNLNVRMIAA